MKKINPNYKDSNYPSMNKGSSSFIHDQYEVFNEAAPDSMSISFKSKKEIEALKKEHGLKGQTTIRYSHKDNSIFLSCKNVADVEHTKEHGIGYHTKNAPRKATKGWKVYVILNDDSMVKEQKNNNRTLFPVVEYTFEKYERKYL